jgi:hypothetical protein
LGQSTFAHVKDISERGSVYNDLGEGEIDEDTEEIEDLLESIASLQQLYAVFLPPHLRVQNPASNCFCANFSKC